MQSTSVSNEVSIETKSIRLHRGQVFDELMKLFLDTDVLPLNIHITMIDCRGKEEQAEDFGGVLRDTLTEFWQDFYKSSTVGNVFEVPRLRSDFGVKEWTLVAKILLYFPILLAPAFIKSCLQKVTSDEDLLDNFLLYVNENDRETLKSAFSNFEDVNEDDLLEIFQTYGAKCIATMQNVKAVIQEIAHKELIQEPCFVAKCFTHILANNLKAEDLKNLYEKLQPTPRNIFSRLKPTYDSEHVVECTRSLDFLKKFLRETDNKTRLAFLRYCTGADLIVNDITIDFIATKGPLKVPIGHTRIHMNPISYLKWS